MKLYCLRLLLMLADLTTRQCKTCGETKLFARGTWLWAKSRGAQGSECLACCKLRDKAAYAARGHVVTEARKLWLQRNPGKVAEVTAAWRSANKDHIRKLNKQWLAANPGYSAEACMKRHALKLQCEPRWLSAEHKAAIKQLYAQAALLTQSTGVQHSIDHIVPLQGSKVTGLHVLWNLQVMPLRENIRKGNRYAV